MWIKYLSSRYNLDHAVCIRTDQFGIQITFSGGQGITIDNGEKDLIDRIISYVDNHSFI